MSCHILPKKECMCAINNFPKQKVVFLEKKRISIVLDSKVAQSVRKGVTKVLNYPPKNY